MEVFLGARGGEARWREERGVGGGIKVKKFHCLAREGVKG